MAAAVHMQLPHQSSADRPQSFDQPRSRSTPPFSSSYDSAPTPLVRAQPRNSSNTYNSSPYPQPLGSSYFPPSSQTHPMLSHSWSTTAMPTTMMYAPSLQPYQSQPGFTQNFPQSSPDFATWTGAYQHMVMASTAGLQAPLPENQGERRRTNSGPQSHHHSQSVDLQSQQHGAASPVLNPEAAKHSYSFHAYNSVPSPAPPRENMPRSISQPILSSDTDILSSSTRRAAAPFISGHHRTSSLNSSADLFMPQLRAGSDVETRKSSVPNEQGSRDESSVVRSLPTGIKFNNPTSSAQNSKAVALPLHTGPIANATNTVNIPGSRSSPLAQAPIAQTSEPTETMMKSGGLKGRLKKALEKDSKREAKTSSPPTPARITPISTTNAVFPSPSETSTRSATPPTTPPQDLPHRSPPFSNPAAFGSSVSLAQTERTATAPSEMTQEKTKKSLFRMKNMSTDNISLASTVSSASMMIRKMGSIGKLARRNR